MTLLVPARPSRSRRQCDRFHNHVQLSLRHRWCARPRQQCADDCRDRHAHRHGGRPGLQPRRPPPSRGHRQGHAAVRLHDRAGAGGGVPLGRHRRAAAGALADAGGRLPDPRHARRCRRHDLGVPQSLRGQRHKTVRPRRLQAVRCRRDADRGAGDGFGRHPSRRSRQDRPRQAPGRRGGPLHRGREGVVGARSQSQRAEDRGRLRQRRRLRAATVLWSSARGHPARRAAATDPHHHCGSTHRCAAGHGMH